MNEPTADPWTNRWPHRWAVLTVCATLALLILGSLVTSLRAGMADREWPTVPWYMPTRNLAEEAQKQGYSLPLFVVEHTHRLAGWFVGFCAMTLCALLWRSDSRKWMRWLGVVALLAVGIQGVLGGMRVRLEDQYGTQIGTILATIHGCTAHAVLAMLASLALFTSSWWTSSPTTTMRCPKLIRLTLWLASFAYLQIVLGAVVRHAPTRLTQRLHFIVAFAVFGLLMHVVQTIRREDQRLKSVSHLLAVLMGLQVLVGVEAWMMRFGTQVLPEMVPITTGLTVVRTLHFTFGSLIFMTTVLLALMARHSMTSPDETLVSPRRDRVMGGVA